MKVPDSWEVDDSEEAIAFLPDGVDDAALVVSSFSKDEAITMNDMHEAIQSAAPDGSSFTKVQLGDFAGYYTLYTEVDEEGEAAWRVWCVFRRDVHLYITYDCPLARRGKDDGAVNDMLKSLRSLQKA